MAGRYRVRVCGPLEGFGEGFRGELIGLGYSWASAESVGADEAPVVLAGVAGPVGW